MGYRNFDSIAYEESLEHLGAEPRCHVMWRGGAGVSLAGRRAKVRCGQPSAPGGSAYLHLQRRLSLTRYSKASSLSSARARGRLCTDKRP